MKMTPKLAVLGTFIGCFICALVVLSVWLAGGGFQGAQASGGDGLDTNIVGIDAITTANTATSLGDIDNCVEVGGVDSTFDVDVFLNDVACVDVAPADTVCDAGSYHNLGAVEYKLNYDDAKLQVNATTHNWLIEVVGAVFDVGDCSALGDPCPDTDGQLYVSYTDGPETDAEPPGSLGVTDRHTFQVVGGDGTLVYLTLTDVYFAGYEPGVMDWSGEIDEIWDGNYAPQYGIIAINTTCPVPNDPPTADDVAPSTNEDTLVPITLTGSDVETCELTFSIVSGPDHGTLGGITDDVCVSGTPNTDSADVDYTPTGDYDGSDSFTYRVYDGQYYSSPATVSITVNPINDAPNVTAPTSMTVPEDSNATDSTTIADVDDTTFTCALVIGSEPTHGNVTFGGNCASVTYTTTDADYNGPDSFTFRVTDDGGGQGAGNELYDDQAVSVTITDVNDAPNVTAPASMTVAEDSNATESTTITDIDDTAFTCTVVSGSEPTHGSVGFGSNCDDVTYTATDLNYNGSDSFTFRVTDDGGGQGSGFKLSDDQAVSVTITPVQDPPVCNDLNVATYPDTPLAVTLDCSDPDVGDTLAYSYTDPPHGTLSGTAPDLTYTPDEGYLGDDSFTYEANDGTVDSNTADADIIVTEDLPPTCSDLTITTPQDTPVAVTLDCTDPEDDDLTYTIVDDPSNGTLSGTAPDLTYTPDSGYVGSDSFTYKANDGTSDSNTADADITVTEVAPPVTASPTPTPTASPTPTPTPTPTPVAVESALAEDAAAGSQEITVEDAEGFAVGDTIQIGTGDTAETCTITDISDSTLTLDCTLEFDHAAGEAVVVAAPATPTPAEVCAPVIPGTYHGSVRLDGVPPPDGKVLKALISETEWASTIVVGGLYVVDIPETPPSYSPCFEGGTITFAVEGYVCSPSPDWASGLYAVDLSCEMAAAPTPGPTPEVTATPGVTPMPVAPPPTGGGGLLHDGSLPWAAALAAAGVLALLLTAVGVSRAARSRTTR